MSATADLPRPDDVIYSLPALARHLSNQIIMGGGGGAFIRDNTVGQKSRQLGLRGSV